MMFLDMNPSNHYILADSGDLYSMFILKQKSPERLLLQTDGNMQARTRKRLLLNEKAKQTRLTRKINSFEEQIVMESVIKF